VISLSEQDLRSHAERLGNFALLRYDRGGARRARQSGPRHYSGRR
jgi:hypothetical protein